MLIPIVFTLFFPFHCSYSLLLAPPVGRGKKKRREKEVKTGKSRKHEFGKWNVLARLNVSSNPRQLQAWQTRFRYGEGWIHR